MHLVLITRQDPPLPIASLRAYERITEIRPKDLRFTVPETSEFLKKFLRRGINESVAVEWTKHTEGWATALHTAAISLVDHQATTYPGRELRGGSHYLHEYLLAEVSSRLPSDNQAWLLKVSLLDRFCASLCEAVCCKDNEESMTSTMNGQTFIRWLRQANLFLINLDERGEWFRFHHLFQDHLQRMLKQQISYQEIKVLHLRASRWFAENGWFSEAIRHALAANDSATAVEIFAKHRLSAMNAERWHELEQWVRLFPEEVVENDPVLLLTRAYLPLSYGYSYDLEAILTNVVSQLTRMPSDSPMTQELRAEVSYFAGLGALMKGPAITAIDAGAELQAAIPPDAYYLRGQALGLQAFGHQMFGNIQQGVQIFQEALSTGDWPANMLVKAFYNQTLLYFMEGDLAAAQTIAEKSIGLASRHNLDASEARSFAGMASYLRNDLMLAETQLLPVMKHSAWVDPVVLTHSACTLMRLYQAQGQPEEARAILEQTQWYLEEIDNTFSQQLLEMFQVELALDRADIAQAHQLSLTQHINWHSPIWFWHYYVPQLTPIKLWLAQGKKLKQALALLEDMDEQLCGVNRNTHRIDILAMQAMVYDAQGDGQMAREKLSAALRLAKLGGFIRNFVDLGSSMAGLLAQLKGQGDSGANAYIARILAAFPTVELKGWDRKSPATISIDPLTKRELEVLKLLAADHSTREIAEEMNVAWSTSRTHIKNIYSKLGVHSRYEAVQRAEELELI
jgi:LuxR family maltose regulon positive regulatory protein